jgi:aspartate/methionine/tyrosine aminotransferase
MTSRLADRMRDIGTEGAFEISARARALEAEGRDIIHLQIGEPDFDTPAHVREAAKAALDAGETHYAPYLGVGALREAIAEDATARKGVPVDPADVIVGIGGKSIIFWTAMAILGPGDEAIVPDPGYPIYESAVRVAGAAAVPLPLRAATDFRVDPDELRSLVTPRTRLLVINSPANPTGGLLTADDLAAIAAVAVEHDLWVLADEIYGRIVYEGEHVSIAALPGMRDRTIVLDGFSKTYAMTGWRLGYGILPRLLVGPFGKLAINTISCAPTFNQLGAVAALRGPQDAVDAMVAEFRARRQLVVDGLDAIDGIMCRRPAGAFYAFPDVSGTGLDGQELYERLLTEAGVCVLPGSAFGGFAGSHVRISYATSRENLRAALERLATFVASLGREGA